MKKKKLMLFVCALAIGLTAGLANADIETGLMGYWPFEEGEGTTTADASSYDHYGTLINGTEWGSGPEGMGGALLFDGADDYVDCNSLISTEAEELTISAWVYYDRSGVDISRYTLVSHRDEGDDMMFHCLIRSHFVDGTYYPNRLLMTQGVTGDWPNNWCYFRDDDTGIGAAVVPQFEWVHVVVTCNGAEGKASAYLNGEFIVTDAFSLPDALSLPTGPACKLLIGWSTRADLDPPYTVREIFCGLLDEVRLYDRILTDEDILELYDFRSAAGYNYTPLVDAGDYQSLVWPNNSVQLDATVIDDGNPVDPCEVTLTWSELSGPGDVTFDPCNAVEDPIVTFSAPGTYQLRLRGFDGEKDACDTVGIVIRADDDPIAHWDFEEGTGGSDVLDSSANSNDGVTAGDEEPNWVFGWVGDWAMDFDAVGDTTVSSYVDITSDVSAADPNLETLRYDITLAAWFKIGDLAVTSSPVIVANGDLGWRLYADHSDGSIVFTPGDGVITDWTKRTTSAKLVDDGYWHHAVGIYDYANSKSCLYIDGVLDAESENVTGMMEEADDKPVIIGARATSATGVARGWNGLIDDVQVYSYCISEARIAALAAMGDLIPQVNAGEDQTVSLQDGAVQLAGTATDDGQPNPSLDLEWTKTSGAGTATFSPSADIEAPTVTFSEADVYVLRLTANDGQAVVFDEVTIMVVNPTCQDVIDDGFLITGDISGPEGTPDCHVDLYDFAFFVGEWLSCNNPSDPACEDPF